MRWLARMPRRTPWRTRARSEVLRIRGYIRGSPSKCPPAASANAAVTSSVIQSSSSARSTCRAMWCRPPLARSARRTPPPRSPRQAVPRREGPSRPPHRRAVPQQAHRLSSGPRTSNDQIRPSIDYRGRQHEPQSSLRRAGSRAERAVDLAPPAATGTQYQARRHPLELFLHRHALHRAETTTCTEC